MKSSFVKNCSFLVCLIFLTGIGAGLAAQNSDVQADPLDKCASGEPIIFVETELFFFPTQNPTIPQIARVVSFYYNLFKTTSTNSANAECRAKNCTDGTCKANLVSETPDVKVGADPASVQVTGTFIFECGCE